MRARKHDFELGQGEEEEAMGKSCEVLAAAHWHQGEMLSLERLDGVWSAQRRKFNLSSHPVCPKPGAHVPAHSVQTMGAFCSYTESCHPHLSIVWSC